MANDLSRAFGPNKPERQTTESDMAFLSLNRLTALGIAQVQRALFFRQPTRPVLPACGSRIKDRQDHVWQRLFGGVSQRLQRSTSCLGRSGLCRDYQTGGRHDE